ncbi:hypothetical protein ACA910_007373 [Epithemia clementina (nom. ined.)]
MPKTNNKNNKNNNISDYSSSLSFSSEPQLPPLLFGWYNVSYVKTARNNENPVGGQWTRKRRRRRGGGRGRNTNAGIPSFLPTLRHSFQHLLPPNTTGVGAPSSAVLIPLPLTQWKRALAGSLSLLGTKNDSAVTTTTSTTTTTTTTCTTTPATTAVAATGSVVVAEAVNVISLTALWDWIRIVVMLRGDCVRVRNHENNNPFHLPPTTSPTQPQSSSPSLLPSSLSSSSSPGGLLPLSPLALRAYFDAPRIVVVRHNAKNQPPHFRRCGCRRPWINVNVGPKSSVVLDTLFVNRGLRLGMGGTSGTRFVFTRLTVPPPKNDNDNHDNDDNNQNQEQATSMVWNEAQECISLLQQRPPRPRRAMATCLVTAGLGFYSSSRLLGGAVVNGWRWPLWLRLVTRLVGWTISLVALSAAALVAFSSGGIERNAMSSFSSRNPGSF